MIWLTRVPETHKKVKEIIELEDENDFFSWIPIGDGYKIHTIETDYLDVRQRWVVVFSEQAYRKECHTLEKNIEDTRKKDQKRLSCLSKNIFSSKKEVEKQAMALDKKLKYHRLLYKIEAIHEYKKKGRPSKGEEPQISYKISGELVQDEFKINKAKNKKGRFILATNQLDKKELPDEEVLATYKGQSKVERGFKFIKDNAFEASSVYLKKPERIQSLMVIMQLALMIYNLSQYLIRAALEKSKESIPNQVKKPTSTPTIKWVYQLFNGILLVTTQIAGQLIEKVLNLEIFHETIIRCLGEKAMAIYGVS